MKELAWFDPGQAVSGEELALAERRLNVKFPPDYAHVVLLHSGACNPDQCEFEYWDVGRRKVGNFGALLGVRQSQSSNIFEVIDNIGDQLPVGVLPVVDTGSGDFVCLDYRKSEVPVIAYFAHERTGEGAIVPLANTFAEFLDLLTEPDEE